MTNRSPLDSMGWNSAFADAFLPHEAAGLAPARVVAEERGHFIVHDGSASLPAVVSGRLRHESAGDPLAFPAVGDWVVTSSGSMGEQLTIQALLARQSAIVRRAPTDHRTPTQIIAANVDIVFIVTSLNGDLNLRRVERYLAVAWESGSVPVVVLSKADLDDDRDGHRRTVESVAPGVEVIVVSALSGDGMEGIHAHLAPGRTVAFIGSSGVGKSTLVNALAGQEIMTTSGIREDDARGRHATTRRQLVPLANGLVIDTPGMRTLALLDGDGLASAFDDVARVAADCRFSNCSHRSEPGCAILTALAAGSLDTARFEAYEALGREARRSELANDVVARRANRRTRTSIPKGMSRTMREKDGDDR